MLWMEQGGATNPTAQTLDPTKGNVYQMKFQWLGFGAITFGVEDASTGVIVPVHRIQYANTNTEVHLLNPSFPMTSRVGNTTNNSNITVKTASMASEIEGKIRLLGPRNTISNTKTGVGTTLTNIVTIRNKTLAYSSTPITLCGLNVCK